MLRGMQSSLNMNKNQLKSKRLSAKSIALNTPSKGNLNKPLKEFDAEKLADFNTRIKIQRQDGKRKKILVFLISILLGLVALFLLFI